MNKNQLSQQDLLKLKNNETILRQLQSKNL